MTPSTPAFDADGLPPGFPFRPEYEIGPRPVAAFLAGHKSRPMLLLDIRPDYEREFSALHPSIQIPMHEIEDRLDDLRDDLDEAGPNTELIIYCHTGVRSLKTALALRAHGFDNALSLAGGVELWAHAIDNTLPRYQKDGARCYPLPAPPPPPRD